MNLPYAKKAARKNRNAVKKVKKTQKVKKTILPIENKVKVNQYPFYPVDLINTWRFKCLPESPIRALCEFDKITEPYKISPATKAELKVPVIVWTAVLVIKSVEDVPVSAEISTPLTV